MKHWLGKTLRAIRAVVLSAFVLSLALTILYKYVPVFYTPYMLVRNAQQLAGGGKVRLRHQWKPLGEISPDFAQAVIASEDYMFLIHNGFDTDKTNLTVNKGARALYAENTTISQRTAQNVFLLPGKGFVYEAVETYFTILIEFVWGKRRILEVYLNSAEVGDAVFGAETAAQEAFAIPARDLDVPQSALLAACLIHPAELDPKAPTTYLLRRQAQIMSVMEEMLEIRF